MTRIPVNPELLTRARERSVIIRHIRNVFAEGELDEKSNAQNLHIAGSDKPVKFYNLDVIIRQRFEQNAAELQAALALLVAEFDAKNKDVMIRLIENMLALPAQGRG